MSSITGLADDLQYPLPLSALYRSSVDPGNAIGLSGSDAFFTPPSVEPPPRQVALPLRRRVTVSRAAL